MNHGPTLQLIQTAILTPLNLQLTSHRALCLGLAIDIP